MALSFLNAGRKRDQLIAVDLGGRTTKAAHFERRAERLTMTAYTVMDAPLFEKSLSPEILAEHLKNICVQLQPKTKSVTLALGPGDALLRHTELPLMPVGDMRQVLRNNPKNYLQQDLSNYIFDCFIIPPRGTDQKSDASKQPGTTTKFRVLVAGARSEVVDAMQTGIRSAGLTASHLVPSLLGPVNAFETAMPEVFAKEVVALVDMGFKHTSICVLEQGELALSRVVAIGGDKITAGLAESMGISYAEAEGIKVGMPQEVESQLEGLLLPLGRELRASIDFFEHQRDTAVSQVFVSGAASSSEFILQILQRELMVECKAWSPLGNLELALRPEQKAELEQVAPRLTTVLGAAYATF